MPSFIEFTTEHSERTFGNPVHDGSRPRRGRDVQGIRVDGDEIYFDDQSIPERVAKYLVDSKKLKYRRIVNDCVAFVALMNSVELKNRSHNPFSNYDENVSVQPSSIDLSDKDPLVLTRGYHDGLRIPVHIVLPAHNSEGPNYLHKLGDKGPLCMSDLGDAMSIMGCSSAHPIRQEKI